MTHILEDPQRLSGRAQRFLTDNASVEPFDVSAGPSDVELREQLSEYFGITDDSVLTTLRATQARYGGLCYYSPSWAFQEVIKFAPWPEYEAADGEPIAWFIEHTVAHPWVVWMGGGGSVTYCFPGDHEGEIVPVFPSGDALIESDALLDECGSWRPVHPAELLDAESVRVAAQHLRPLRYASGFTEWWWEQDGFRVHVSHTFAHVFEQQQQSRWWTWARDAAGERSALAFLRQAAKAEMAQPSAPPQP